MRKGVNKASVLTAIIKSSMTIIASESYSPYSWFLVISPSNLV